MNQTKKKAVSQVTNQTDYKLLEFSSYEELIQEIFSKLISEKRRVACIYWTNDIKSHNRTERLLQLYNISFPSFNMQQIHTDFYEMGQGGFASACFLFQ